ncbi:hypothetical protein MTO96_029620 [Rhipicephalus appendiculatus]
MQRDFNINRLQALHNLLKPLADATDRLQSDGVTSSELHLTICQCYTQVKDTATEFTKLKKRLLKELNDRFEGALQEAHFVAASVLNPRQKLRVFHPSVAPELKQPSADEATITVRKLLKEADAEFHLAKGIVIRGDAASKITRNKKPTLVLKDTARAIWGREILATKSVTGTVARRKKSLGEAAKETANTGEGRCRRR